ncbi:hypothetical protein ABGB16_27370 [Micromonospora sp. B11E3]
MTAPRRTSGRHRSPPPGHVQKRMSMMMPIATHEIRFADKIADLR